MMKSLLCALFVFVTVPAFAQTEEASLDLAGLGWGAINTPISIETDGDFSTREWLIRTADTRNMYRVVAERAGGLCAGEWFNPAPVFSNVSIQRIGLVHKMVVRPYGANAVTLISLDTPPCQ